MKLLGALLLLGALGVGFLLLVGGGVVVYFALQGKTPDVLVKDFADGKPKPGDANKKDDEAPPRLHGIPFHAIADRARLEQVRTVQVRGKIHFVTAINVNEVTITWEGLRRLRYDELVASEGSSIVLLRGKHGWMTMGPRRITLQGDGLGFYQNFNYATVLSNLIALTEEGFVVEQKDDLKIRGKQCSAFVVKRAGRPDLKMFFDRHSELLFKTEFTGRFVDQDLRFMPNDTLVEFYYSDYEVVDGIRHWKKQEQWRDGRKFSEINLSDIRFMNKSDDALFMVDALANEIRGSIALEKLDDIKKVLAELGDEPGSDFTRLVKGLDHADGALRGKARGALKAHIEIGGLQGWLKFGPGDATALVRLLSERDDTELSKIGLDGLTTLGPAAAPAAPALAKLARETPDLKYLVPLRDTGVKTDDTFAVFDKLTSHPSQEIRELSTLMVLSFGPSRFTLNRLSDLMKTPNDEIRGVAEKVLRQKLTTVTRQDLPALRQGLKNPQREVRVAFIDAVALLKTDGADAAPDLALLLPGADAGLSQQIIEALHGMNKLVDVARDAKDVAVLAPTISAVRAKQIKTAEALTLYEKNLDHAAISVKDPAALALLEFGPERLQIDRLTELMGRPNEEVKVAAGKLLRVRLSGVTKKDLPSLRMGLKHPVRDVQLSFLEAIASLRQDGKDAAVDLGELAAAGEQEVALQAIRAIEGLGKDGDKAVPMLGKAVDGFNKTIALAATLALCKIDPKHPAVQSKGVTLLVESATPNLGDLKAFVAQPLANRSAAALVDVGEPAVAPLVKHLIARNEVKGGADKRLPEATAARYMGFEILHQLAKQAKAKDDKKLTIALKKHEPALKVIYEPAEAALAKQAMLTPTLTPETRQLYIASADAAYKAYKAVSSLRNP